LATCAVGPWLPLWAELAAQLNRARRAFRDTVAGLLEREGYRREDADPEPETLAAGVAAGVQLREMVEAATADHRQRIIDSAVISDADAKRLQDRRRGLSPAERAQLERWRINRAWGLAGAPPSADLIEADNNGDHDRYYRSGGGGVLLNQRLGLFRTQRLPSQPARYEVNRLKTSTRH
ncbi:MAG: hypothetical protein ACK53L_31285, partial [Pirellulaceae bacterium]